MRRPWIPALAFAAPARSTRTLRRRLRLAPRLRTLKQYLQGYAGGAGNNPATWNRALGMTVDPGLWSGHGSGCSAGDSPAIVQSKTRSWKTSAGITGGFVWLYDDMKACAAQDTAAAYASAIRNGVS